MLIVFKDRILRDTVALTKRLLQQEIRQHTEPLSLFMFELQRLLPPLLRNFLQRRLEIKRPYILTHQSNHNYQLSVINYSNPSSGMGILRLGFSLAPRSTSSRPFCATL